MLSLRRLKTFYKFIVISLIFSFFIFSFLIFLLYFFHFQTSMSSVYSKKMPYLFSPWPTKVTDEQTQEMKKLKKYNKSEQKRRLEKQQQQMLMLNVPIYNLFLDESPIFSSPNVFPSYGNTSFLWPIIPSTKIFRNNVDANIKRRSSYVLFPNVGWTQIRNGIYLSGGEELKFDIPLSKERRYLNFNVFPISEGNIQVTLGQHGWSHVFREDEIQTKVSFSIPIYDATASAIKISSGSLSYYLTDILVSHILSTGRQPIHVSDSSIFWNPDPNLINNNVLPPEDKNPQVLVSEKFSTALGYNVVLIHLNNLDSRILNNRKVLSKVMPNIGKMIENSIYFKKINVASSSFDSFRRFSFINDKINYKDAEISIIKNILDQDKKKSVYLRFQKYGYKTLALIPPQEFFFSKDIAKKSSRFHFYNRWLDSYDWIFQKESAEIDDKAEPASGLQAIFKQQERQISPPVLENDYKELSSILGEVSKNLDRVPEWNANEYVLIDPQNQYVPMAIEAFKKWTLDNNKERFFAHIFLNDKSFSDKPFLKDLGKSFFVDGLSSFFNPMYLKNIAYASFIDRAFAQILDTLHGRRLENRTIFFVLFQDKKEAYKAQGFFYIPGLLPKINVFDKEIDQNDILSTLFSTVGIPSGSNVQSLDDYHFGSMLEAQNQNLPQFQDFSSASGDKNYYKYVLMINPGTEKESCKPFQWKTDGASFFGLESDYPIYSFQNDHSIEIFPCSSKNKIVKISWYQSRGSQELVDSSSSQLIRTIGGHFAFEKGNEDLPEFYFGKNLISMEHVIFSMEHLTEPALKKTFFVETNHLDQVTNKVIGTFSKQNKKSQVAFFISPI